MMTLRTFTRRFAIDLGKAGIWVLDLVPEALMLGGATALTWGLRLQLGLGAAWIAGGLLALLFGWRLGRPQPATPKEPNRG